MKRHVFLIFILCLAFSAFGQENRLTQAEYVKMLYTLQKNPSGKADIIEALRKRGIDFVLTDGLRSLTRSKGANDDELKRALEEADRRRIDPVATKLPTEKEAATVLENAKKHTLIALEEMPDFVVKQQIKRSYAYAGTGNYLNADQLVVAVSYSTSLGEQNKILTLNGVLQENPRPNQLFSDIGGYTSIGEFVGFLSGVFKPESETIFGIVDTDLIGDRKTIVWDYRIKASKASYKISSGDTSRVINAGYEGKIWIDRQNFRVLRFEMNATEIPPDYPVRRVHRIIDYDWVTINNDKYLLPITADVSLIGREKNLLLESRNRSRFKNYQKYGTDVKILDDDIKPETEPKKP